MRDNIKQWLKKPVSWLEMILVLLVLFLTFTPFIPSNAVRLCILQSGHPIAAVLSGPSKLPKSEIKYYSGSKSQLHYQINVPFSTESADVDVVVVHKVSKNHFYDKYVATPAYAVGPWLMYLWNGWGEGMTLRNNQIPMKLFGFFGLVVTAFCILGYMINEEAISAQAASPINNWVWGITTVFAIAFTICSFLNQKRFAIISFSFMVLGMVIYFGFLS
ncbi:hypothetical protein [Levilactobacillus wangkuiensis]|uniref:hypothetical protein n=1 Tax=Levilactobacillus wangkuiensis TaxID=2799566 RepID=UPI001944AB1D|nr:hypothetical protein [Levilactobacillus wangkuiensis]